MENDSSSQSNDENPPSQSLQFLSISPQIQMSFEERLKVIKSIGEECMQEKELESLLAIKSQPICYDGFEPSGRMHIAQGVMKAMNVNKLTSCGCKVRIWIADWFAQLNNKMGGDLKKIQVVGQYLIEIWKSAGMNLDNVEFLWSSEEINSRAHEYWPIVMDIARRNNLPRIVRCGQIMGRSEMDELTAAQIFYPCMQCADIFFLEADICQLGMDQRKVNVLAREYCDDIKRKNKPIILSHHMLPGLQGQVKMSKSDPLSAIYMEDEEGDVNLKIEKALCPPPDPPEAVDRKTLEEADGDVNLKIEKAPPKVVEGKTLEKAKVINPCLEYIKYIVFPWFNEFTVERKDDNGGDKTFKSFEDLADDYKSGKLRPEDLRPALSKAINRIIQPVRDHFNTDPKAKELLKRVKSYKNDSSSDIKDEIAPSQSLQSLSVSPQIQMSLNERLDVIRSIGECIEEEELERLLANKPQPICYDGFEPSGRMHIAQGVMKAINVNKLASSGCKIKIVIADWFAQLNDKMGGDLRKIQVVGQYHIEIWKSLGMNNENVEFIWSSEEINSRPHEYWPLVMDIARRNMLPRIKKCFQILGRSKEDELTVAQIFYTCMQCADIFFLKADICQMGMDQREVNVLAREYCDDIMRENKPIILSHHMLPGVLGQEKMSSSDPSSAIYMEDEESAVNLKIKKALCPPKVVEKNPCLEYIEHIVFPWFNEFTVERKPGNGGDKTFKSFKDLSDDYESGDLHPGDLKPALSKAINRILQPVRDHFNTNPEAKELLKRVKSYKVTR